MPRAISRAPLHGNLLPCVRHFMPANAWPGHAHVRKGRVMTDLNAKALELRTRELFTECLVSLGAVTKDMDVFTV